MKNTTLPRTAVRHITTAPSAANVTESAANTTQSSTETGPDQDETGQLTLLTVEPDTRAHQLPTTAQRRHEVHARFRLSKETREIGLRHVTEIRKQLEEAKAAREATDVAHRPRGRPAA